MSLFSKVFSLRYPLIRNSTLLALCLPTGLAAAQWVPLGPSPTIVMPGSGGSTNVVGIDGGRNPVSGAMRAVLPDPGNPNGLYAAAVNGGVWHTANGGQHWTPLGDELASLSIGAMSFDQSNSGVLWVGFGRQSSFGRVGGAHSGVVRYDTASGAWSPPLSTDLMGKDISRIIADGNNVLVGIRTSKDAPGVWRSADGGVTFSNVSSGLPNGNITGLVRDPTNPSRYYVAVASPNDPQGIYRSDDGGASWTRAALDVSPGSSVPGTMVTRDIMLSVAKDGTLVASLIDAPVSANGSGVVAPNPRVVVYRSSDQGQNWTSMGSATTTEKLPDGRTLELGVYNGGQFNLHGYLLVDPKDANVVYISGDSQGPPELFGSGQPNAVGARFYSGRLFRGRFDPATGQTRWEAITDAYTGNGSGPHADSRFMWIDAAGNLLQSDDGGVYLRTDPKSRDGVWLSLNGNLQTGEIHDAVWNPLSHTLVTAMQDNGATVQIRKGDPTHAVVSGGDGGIAAVNARYVYGGARQALVYTSSQYLGGVNRMRFDATNEPAALTYLEIGVQDGGTFKQFGDGAGALKPARPKSPMTKGEALAVRSQAGIETIPFYPSFVLNALDPARIAVGGYDLYIGRDSLAEGEDRPVRIEMQKLTDLAASHLPFISLAYGAVNQADALLGGSGYVEDLNKAGALYYTPAAGTVAPLSIYSGTGVQAVLFDRERGAPRVYFSDGLSIRRASDDTGGGAYSVTDISGDLPASFNERRGLAQVYGNGVSALAAAGTHNAAGGNWLYTLRGPADATAYHWDTRLGRLPNSQIFGLDYSDEDDVLLAYTMGRGAFALYDVTTYYPEATRLVFGKADNASRPGSDQLADGTRLDGSPFSRSLIKAGSGILDLTGAAAGYSGGSELNGGVVVVDADANLGAAGTGVRFDGGTLGFAAAFSLARPLTLHAGGGTLDTNGLALTQAAGQPIGGDGRLTVAGGGSYRLTESNAYAGGTRIAGAGTRLEAAADANLGAATGDVRLAAGSLKLLDGFALGPAGSFSRWLTVEESGGAVDLGSNALRFTGVLDLRGAFTQLGNPWEMAGELRVNTYLPGPLNIGAEATLRGAGVIVGAVNVAGRLYPGNSPGTLTVIGPVLQAPGSFFAVDVDGTGTGNGAGNYSRLLVQGAAGSYTADGTFIPVLRGITGSASNRYTPPLGQGFTVVQAEGGVLGGYAGLTQPAAGLLPGARFDLLYGSKTVQLYATPASYAELAPLGIASNGNMSQVGNILERVRPAAGVRPPDTTKALFDGLAPVSVAGMRQALDQLGGVSHAQLLGADLGNSKFLGSRLIDLIAAERRGERSGREAARDAGGGLAWTYAVGRMGGQDGDHLGYGVRDSLGGVLTGVEKRPTPDAVAGVALGYVNSDATVAQGMGSGRLENWQLMAYGSREREGAFVEGAAGFGIGKIAASRYVGLGGGGSYSAEIRSRHLTVAGQTGWRLGGSDGRSLEASVGLQYVASRHAGFSDRGNGALPGLSVDAGSLRSLAASVGLAAGMPFEVGGIDWRLSLRGRYSRELLDERASINVTFLGAPMRIEAGAPGRDTVTLGVGVAGRIGQRVSLHADLTGEAAARWSAAIASVGVRILW